MTSRKEEGWNFLEIMGPGNIEKLLNPGFSGQSSFPPLTFDVLVGTLSFLFFRIKF
jgi:hypothetical protein